MLPSTSINYNNELLYSQEFPYSWQSDKALSDLGSPPKTLAFIDPSIGDYTTIISQIEADIKVVLNSQKDGIDQISEVLSRYKNLTSISVISHGNVANLQLGNGVFNKKNFNQYTNKLEQWNTSFAPGANILIFGCNVAQGETGRAFIDALSRVTGADIAASTNLTGNSSQGGDWLLEYTKGNIETTSPVTTSFINTYQGILVTQSLFTNQTPSVTNATDGTGSDGDYELGMEFISSQPGKIQGIRYYKAPSETGIHTGRIWSATGQLLSSVTFANETASGWQEQSLTTPLNIRANTIYIVSVNINSYYVSTTDGLAASVSNGNLTAVADGSNGVFNVTPGSFPGQSFRNSNYFRDIVFATISNPDNQVGAVSLSGTAREDQSLTANVTDGDGITVPVSYQWQQSSNNGTSWTDITGASDPILSLGQQQVGSIVRVRAIYTDGLGTGEQIFSSPSTGVVNVNDIGTVSISGTTSVGSTVTAIVSDEDGLTGATISYQWQKFTNNAWSNIAGATNPTLSLDNTYLGQQVRVNASYTDALGANENIFSPGSNPVAATLTSLFTNQTPSVTNATDGTGSDGDYELGMEFISSQPGKIQGIRYYKAPSETGIHTGRIWSATGQLLSSVTFANETASGWQEQSLTTPLNIRANTIYIVSVNINSYYVSTTDGLAASVSNGNLTAVADGSNGVFNVTPGSFPGQSFRNSNYFRDIVFATISNPDNQVGAVSLSGTAREDQSLTANVTDGDGITVPVSYQWQQSSNNGTSWTDITGASDPILSLGQQQVGSIVRVRAIYTDGLGTGEQIFSSPSTGVVNVNDIGTVSISGTTSVGSTVTAIVSDEDGLTGATISYQWQRFTNNAWSNIAGATGATLTLDNTLLGQQVRVNAAYTDALGGNENIFSAASNPISAIVQTLFTAQTPNLVGLTDGIGSDGDYELGMKFRSTTDGQIQGIRYYKSPGETGVHIGRIWSATGQLLSSVTFANETASAWQEQSLATPLNIGANTTYIVSVNVNTHYVATTNGLAGSVSKENLQAVPDGSNGVFNVTPGTFPGQSYQNSNYFRDIVFTTAAPNPNNQTGVISVSGIPTEDQILTASVTDEDDIPESISYRWQQSPDNGTSWTDITGASNATLSLGQQQVGSIVRVRVTYTDGLGTYEQIFSSPSTEVINVQDIGTVTIGGIPSLGNTLTASVVDEDGLSVREGGTNIDYQWQISSDNGATWSNISGATDPLLPLSNTLIGKILRVNATYIDLEGTGENIFSQATDSIAYTFNSLFTAATTPTITNESDGVPYELGMEFQSIVQGEIRAIRYWKAPSETGTHVGKIWSNTGNLLASVIFTDETASGWQEQRLLTPLRINPGVNYTVSVNINNFYVATPNGLSSSIIAGNLRALADGSNGVYGPIGTFPSQSYNTNYFRDVVFSPTTLASNTPGAVNILGVPIENQTLTAEVTDINGLSGVNILYRWQKLENGRWIDIAGETRQTLLLDDHLVNKPVRVNVEYVDSLGSFEPLVSGATTAVSNVNDPGVAILSGSATVGYSLTTNSADDDGLVGIPITYQWQKLENGNWLNILGATGRTLNLDNSLVGKQVRVATSYTDQDNTLENVFSAGVLTSEFNPIVLENQNPGTRDWEITNLATNNEIAGYASATSVNRGEILPIKVSLARPGEYKIDIYRLGYYGGSGGRFITGSGLLNGITQAGPTIDPATRLVEYNWTTSYNLQVGTDWTSGLYVAKLTEVSSAKESQLWFTVRNDDRPTNIGFQASFTTYEAYNNYGGYSTYNFNSIGGQRAYAISFDRPFAQTNNVDLYNNPLTWEYNMLRWLESQGYDISYYTNLDVHRNPLQLYSQNVFLSAGHDEYWSLEMFNNVERARDNGINLAFFSANTAYWRVRFEPSSTGEANRVMVVYKQSWFLDPVAQNDVSQATTWFRSPEVNRPENSLLGVYYVGDYGALGENAVYNGADFVVNNSSDPYYANTGLQDGDVLPGLVGYEWDAVVNNGATPAGLVILSQSTPQQVGGLPPLPTGTNPNISNAVRYTAASGAKVFSTGSIQWMWGLDSDRVTNPRVDRRARQIAVNVFADLGALPQLPSLDIVVP